ncbi:MAG: hypothetical protein NC102_08370, partial [Clostridium sp.]|nr:hypothetical protein [Clostridium sp.]
PVARGLRQAAGGRDGEGIIIMGNGPSLADDIANHAEELAQWPTMAVNFAANAPEFARLRPAYYIMIDPHFFSGKDDPNLHKLWRNLASVDWPMTLILPRMQKHRLPKAVLENANISIACVNPVAVEGWGWLESAAYASGLGMPRPRNVLIPAIMAAMVMGYKEIYLCGADHSWLKTISVDDENCVVSIQPHFYKEDERELKRQRIDYMKYPLHQILESFSIAFASYHRMRKFADKKGVRIYNATPGSYIDAFERRAPWGKKRGNAGKKP